MLPRNRLLVFVYKDGPRTRALKGYLIEDDDAFYTVRRPLGQLVMLRISTVERVQEWEDNSKEGQGGEARLVGG